MVESLRERASERKLRLLACGVIRSAPISPDGRAMWELAKAFVWFEQKALRYENDGGEAPVQPQELVTTSCHEAVEIAERYCDGAGMGSDLATAADATFAASYCAEVDTFGHDPALRPASEYRYRIAGCFEHATASADRLVPRTVPILDYLDNFDQPISPEFLPAVVSIVRDIFGNPFRPVTCSADWRTATVRTLARQMYESRDFSAVPILADALQDAGCDDADILDHCRGPGPHARGCWVVDLVLGKE